MTVSTQAKDVVRNFEDAAASVLRMADLDRAILDSTLTLLHTTQRRLRDHHRLDNPRLTVETAIKSLEGIREHESLRPHYESMFNQCVVLLVSHFTAALADLFHLAVVRALEVGADAPALGEDLRVSLVEIRDLQASERPLTSLSRLAVQKRGMSFQDMQGTVRAFREWSGVEIARSPDMETIIVGQAARHVIVHDGARVNEVFLKRTAASLRGSKLTVPVEEGERLQFQPGDVAILAESMSAFLTGLAAKVGP